MSSDSYVMSISIFCENGKTFYILNGYKYDSEFPLKWALNHLSKPYEDASGNIFINGSGPSDCENCRNYGSENGIFREYCSTCQMCIYNGQRYIPKFTSRTEDIAEEIPYSSDMEIDEEEDEYIRKEREEAREEEKLAIRMDKFISRHDF